MLPSDPIPAIEFTMEQIGFGQSDLAKLFGKSRASDILNRKHGLSRPQAITLYNEWGVRPNLYFLPEKDRTCDNAPLITRTYLFSVTRRKTQKKVSNITPNNRE